MLKKVKKFISVEDHWAIVIGLLVLGIMLFFSLMKFGVSGEEGNISILVSITDYLKTMTTKPLTWEANPIKSLVNLEDGVNLIPNMLVYMAFLMLVFGAAAKALGSKFRKFIVAFVGLFVIVVLSYVFSAQVSAKQWGLNYALWAIAIGMLISNTIGTPKWVKPALLGELYIKTGLVLLGAEILIPKILAIGLPGIFVTWVVTPIVLIGTYIFGQKVLKIESKSLNMTICADMSVCGVSAAIATSMACKAKKEELTLAISFSMLFTAIMMVLMPLAIKALGLSQVLGGALLGGTLDATGAVVAAGAFLGDTALEVAATIKMIQNVLIGFIAFGVAVYWTTKVDRTPSEKPKVSEIFSRFPRFLIGFIGASVVFSLVYYFMGPADGKVIVEQGVIGGFTKGLKGWLFCMAFVSIGLNTNFKELRSSVKSGKPILLYICGQTFNIILTFAMAYLMFEICFPDVASKL